MLLGGLLLAASINLCMVDNSFAPLDVLLDDTEALATGEEGRPTCAAGGCYARSCSFSGEIVVLGNGAHYTNSVECEDAWACCYTTAYCFPKSRC